MSAPADHSLRRKALLAFGGRSATFHRHERSEADKGDQIRRGYNNEKETGETVSSSGLSKGDVWVTSKRELQARCHRALLPKAMAWRRDFSCSRSRSLLTFSL